MGEKQKMKKGFTLIELVLGTGIMLLTILGILAVYNHSILLNRYSEGVVLALESSQGKLEEMKNHSYDDLETDYGSYPVNTFPTQGLDGMGSISFETNPPVGTKGAWVVVCWREKGRLFGEDGDLDGRLDAGEDTNGDNRLSSPVELFTQFTQGS